MTSSLNAIEPSVVANCSGY